MHPHEAKFELLAKAIELSGAGRRDLVDTLVDNSPNFTFFRVIDVPVGIFLAQLPQGRVRIVHMPEVMLPLCAVAALLFCCSHL